MKIKSVRIQKFRSINDATISFVQVIAIVGANNVGKSHILRALNSFFNFSLERESFVNHDHAFSLKSRPKITITFTEILPSDNISPDLVYNNILTIIFLYRWDRSNPTYEVLIGNNHQTIDQAKFAQLTNKFRFIYIPVIRNYQTMFDNNTGIASNLLSAIIEQQTANRNTIQPLVNRLFDKVESTAFRTALQRINRFYPFNDGNEFELKITNANIIDDIIRNVSIRYIENSQINDIWNCGSGIQSAVYFAVSLAIYMNDDSNFLVGIEEPELNMHHQAQRKLIETLKDISRYPQTQFALTTHSPVIIDHIGHSDIALCRKVKGETRDVITYVTQIPLNFWEKYHMEEERYYNFYEYKNSDFFFSNYIIITESPIDCNVFADLFKRSGIDPGEYGISFIPANGEKSIKYPYSLTKELGIPFLCIVDRDVFQPYIGDDRKSSLNDNGIPQYKPEAKTSSPFCDLLEQDDIPPLLEFFTNGEYNSALELLKKYSIIMMRYALEVDLIACDSYCQAYCDALEIHGDNRNSYYLLTEKSKKIKALDVIQNVMNNRTTRNLPISYKRILQFIREMISSN